MNTVKISNLALYISIVMWYKIIFFNKHKFIFFHFFFTFFFTFLDPVLHIDLRKWAHVLVIAPLDANTLGKIANGLCDNLLTCILRAWDFETPSKPVVVCPAMNTCMYKHPITSKQLEVVTKELGFRLVEPVEKVLACGDKGVGAMAEPVHIANFVYDLVCSSVKTF